jgi:transposase-like protein
MACRFTVLDEIVQIRRNTKAARRLLNRLLRKQGMAPKRRITGKLGSYGGAKKQVMPKVDHRAQKGLNIRAENSHVSCSHVSCSHVSCSHVPFRKPEWIIQHVRLA